MRRRMCGLEKELLNILNPESSNLSEMDYYHVDVFSNKKYSGNGLTVFNAGDGLEKAVMQTLTQEMRQFESIFFYQRHANTFRAFIFTMSEELDFAGYPVLGLAATLHYLYSKEAVQSCWTIELNRRSVQIETTKKAGYYAAQMNQGRPEFGAILNGEQESAFLSYLNLSPDDKFNHLPLQVVSTGLPYLIVPIKAKALSSVKVTITDLARKLQSVGARFFFVFDVENNRGRTWDNAGLVEDIATGSAAGPVGSYLVNRLLHEPNREMTLSQGEFLGRPSTLKVLVRGTYAEITEVFVEGDVCMIAAGKIITG